MEVMHLEIGDKMDQRRGGFTLIELLVVIAIIGILAALLFPVFARAKAAAQSATSLSNVRQLVMASLLYAESSDDRLPLVTEGPLATGRVGGYTMVLEFGQGGVGRFDPAQGSLYPYVKSAGIYGSAADPSARESKQSFAINGCLAEFPPQRGLMAMRGLTITEEPSRQFMFGEELCGREGTNDGFFHPLYDELATWHNNRNAMAFVDGHAKLTLVEGRYSEVVDASDIPCWPNDPW
jgi:prepilin-type N-terminal cleavage/methylation domain-containing protein/prepilin-type processing-associated H-X9-DG protein